MDTVSEESLGLRAEPLSWHVGCTHTSMTKITTPSENCSTWHTLSPIHILHSTVNFGSTNTFCRQKLDYCALSLFGGIHGTIVNCYLASASVNNTLPLSSVYQISPEIHCHLPGKSQSSTAGNNGAPTSVPLSLGHALYNADNYWLALAISFRISYFFPYLQEPTAERCPSFFKFYLTIPPTAHIMQRSM